MPQTLVPSELEHASATLRAANARVLGRCPGDSSKRQPVHTVYGGAHLFRSETPRKLAELALRALETYAPDGAALGAALGLPVALAAEVHARVVAKLGSEAVEDYRIDFEDGYGHRSDEEEDGHALAAAEQLGLALEAGRAPAFFGLRIKSFGDELFPRSARTLDLFVTRLAETSRATGFPSLLVTLPKVTSPEQVAVLSSLLGALERRLGLAAGTLLVELMVETPQAIFTPDGRAALPALVAEANGRCSGVHFGSYDYTASCGITAQHQSMRHPACDFAKHLMQVTLAGTGVFLSDGATTAMPVAPHRMKPELLTDVQREENLRAVHQAWRVHYGNVRHSLEGGFYQGWDLHPAQLPIRYAAVYAFFLEALPRSSARLKAFMDMAAQATRLGDSFDDAATGQGLLNFFLRGRACGALTDAEVSTSGLTPEELQTRSFRAILGLRYRDSKC